MSKPRHPLLALSKDFIVGLPILTSELEDARARTDVPHFASDKTQPANKLKYTWSHRLKAPGDVYPATKCQR